MKIRVLITGQKGFLGTCLWDLLKFNKKIKLYGCDNNIYSNKISTFNKFQNFKINDLKNIDLIIHLAGVSTNYDPKGKIYKKISNKVNFKDTISFAKIAKKAGVKKFIFASSTSVYGDKKNKLVSEKSKLSPTTSYGRSKSLAERHLVKLSNKNFKTILLRMVTLFGNSKRMRFDLLVNNLIASYIKYKKVVLLSDGQKIRPQIHIKDVSEVYKYFILNDIKQNNLILNVGRSDYNLTVGQIARKIAKVFKSKVQYGKKDKDKRSYRVSFKKFEKLKIINKTSNSIENTAIKINKSFKNKNTKFMDNKKFKNLDFMKYLIGQKKINLII